MQNRLEILNKILAIDSTNGNEEPVAEVIQKFLLENNIPSKIVPYSFGRANLVAEIGEGDKVLGISGHMDVVSAGNLALWNTPPFQPQEIEGRIYARGASDMKGGLCALLMAMVELHAEKVHLNGKIKLLATVGEEIGMLGAKQLTEEGYADDLHGLIIGEPTGHRIVYAHKGIFSYKVTSFGKSAHSSMPEFGINAIDNLIVFYNTIASELKKTEKTNEALGPLVVSNTIITGGDQLNSVPDTASLSVNIRTIPEMDNGMVEQLLQQTVEQLNSSVPNMNLKLEILQNTPPVLTNKNGELVAISKKEADLQFKEDVPLLAMSGGADSAEFIRANKDLQIVIFGPGNETLHQVNEYIDIDNYLEMIDLYKKIITEYLS